MRHAIEGMNGLDLGSRPPWISSRLPKLFVRVNSDLWLLYFVVTDQCLRSLLEPIHEFWFRNFFVSVPIHLK